MSLSDHGILEQVDKRLQIPGRGPALLYSRLAPGERAIGRSHGTRQLNDSLREIQDKAARPPTAQVQQRVPQARAGHILKSYLALVGLAGMQQETVVFFFLWMRRSELIDDVRESGLRRGAPQMFLLGEP